MAYSALMSRFLSPFLIRIAAAFIALQALWSGIATTAYAAGFDQAKYLCATVALDAQARAEIAELMALTGLDQADEREPVYDPTECPVCGLGKASVLAGLTATPLPADVYQAAPSVRRLDQLSPRWPVGPPVGLRAPPFQI